MNPTYEAVMRVVREMGFDYIQARNHLIGRYLAQQHAQRARYHQ